MKTLRPSPLYAVALACGVLLSSPALARTAESEAAVKAAKERYSADREACRARSGNDRDVCFKEAKARRRTAIADADVMNHNTRGNRQDAVEARRKGQYDVAIEKCDALSGDAKSACELRAKARAEDMKAREKTTR